MTRKERYEAKIPDCCQFRTFEEHYDKLLFCWGILAAIDDNREMKCVSCEFATRNPGETKQF